MSLIVTAYTQEGIVIGADSCITTNFTQEGKELYKHSHCGNKRKPPIKYPLSLYL